MKIRSTAYGYLLCKPPCRAPANGYLLRDWLHPVHSGQVPLELLQISGVVLPVVHGRVDFGRESSATTSLVLLNGSIIAFMMTGCFQMKTNYSPNPSHVWSNSKILYGLHFSLFCLSPFALTPSLQTSGLRCGLRLESLLWHCCDRGMMNRRKRLNYKLCQVISILLAHHVTAWEICWHWIASNRAEGQLHDPAMWWIQKGIEQGICKSRGSSASRLGITLARLDVFTRPWFLSWIEANM